MVLLELEYLSEIKRIRMPAVVIQLKLNQELGVEVCQFNFHQIVQNAFYQKWTRDPFDRIIVAHAEANHLSYLISADHQIRQHYPNTLW